jgi:exopolyphosphatase / guanosine-5'-triphosphate,3'-diphosphate pyrophosphatase
MTDDAILQNLNTVGKYSQQRPILAAIDIGTNSLHMVVVEIKPELPAFSVIAREKDTVRLGDRDPLTGNLNPVIMDKAIAALGRYQTIAQSLGAQEVIAVATSATREAPNGREFIDQIDRELGLKVDLISGVEEARRIYLGVLSGLEFNNIPRISIDIGGGSTEMILGDSEEPRTLSSTKIGAVRLTSELVTTDPISDKEFIYLQAYICGQLERAIEEIKAYLKPGEMPQMVGTSGTDRNSLYGDCPRKKWGATQQAPWLSAPAPRRGTTSPKTPANECDRSGPNSWTLRASG